MSANADRSPYTRDWLTQALARPSTPTNRAPLALTTPEKKPMSYSISVRAASIAAALAALATKFDEDVVAKQPIHAQDRTMALGVAHAVAAKAVEPKEGHEVVISLWGSIYAPTVGQYSLASLSAGSTINYVDSATNIAVS